MYHNQTFRYFSLLIITGLLMINFQNCQSSYSFDPSVTQNSLSDPGGGSTSTGHTLKTMKPALAVRGVACLFCHADVRANVITDFGFGDPFYLGNDMALDGVDGSPQSWYNNDAHTWQSMKNLNGTVIVPNQLIPQHVQDSMGVTTANGAPPMNIEGMLRMPYQATWNWDLQQDGSSTLYAQQGQGSMLMKVQPQAGQAQVVSVKHILISSPSEADINSIAGGLATDLVIRVGNRAPVQFVNVNGTSGTYIANDPTQTLQCSNSDIVVRGTLYLRKLKLNATGGCRLYVTGSVFIEGNIFYSDSGATQNLQITSANAIIMGINHDHLVQRWNDRRLAAISDPLRNFDSRFQQIIDESVNIGSLADAADASPRTSIDYHGLLLNAPIIEGRYLGSIRGTIISQLALFALENFHFVYDEVFSNVDVFPLLTKPILLVE